MRGGGGGAPLPHAALPLCVLVLLRAQVAAGAMSRRPSDVVALSGDEGASSAAGPVAAPQARSRRPPQRPDVAIGVMPCSSDLPPRARAEGPPAPVSDPDHAERVHRARANPPAVTKWNELGPTWQLGSGERSVLAHSDAANACCRARFENVARDTGHRGFKRPNLAKTGCSSITSSARGATWVDLRRVPAQLA